MTAEQAEPETTTIATSTLQDMRDANVLLRRRNGAMRELIAIHIAKALDSREKGRWDAAVELVEALHEADTSVYVLVDKWLASNGWDPRAAYKPLAGSSGWIGYAAEKDTGRDPWAPAPDLAAQIPEPVRRVLAGHLAEMLLDPKADAVQKWARGITFELKREGFDLGDAIKKRITDLTLGADPSDPPF